MPDVSFAFEIYVRHAAAELLAKGPNRRPRARARGRYRCTLVTNDTRYTPRCHTVELGA